MINDSIELGSVLPQLLVAKQRNLGVIVMNPNKSTDDEGRKI
jgi:hypothetical protein